MSSITNDTKPETTPHNYYGSETTKGAGRKVLDFIHTANDELVHAKDSVTTRIRSNPVQSSAIALVAGLLIGALLRR